VVADAGLAVLLYAHAWAHPASITAGSRQDAPYTIWAFAWVARALAHGQSPFVTRSLSWPAGVNLLTNATLAGVGVVLAPVTWVFGPLVAYNVAACGALAATAWSAQVVIVRAGLARWPAAVCGGLAAGFGPTLLVQDLGGHLHIASCFLVPPLLLGVGRLATGTAERPWRWGVAVGALAAAQLLVGEEVLAIVAITVAVGVVVGVLAGVVARAVAGRWRARALAGRRARPAVGPVAGRGRARPSWAALVVAGVAFAVLGCGPLLVQFLGRGHISGPIQRGAGYPDDLTGFITPPRQLVFHTPLAERVTRRYTSEGGAYLGIPLVLAMVAAVVVAWRRPLVRVIGATALVMAVFSMGARPVIDGHRYAGVPLPWALLGRLPLLQSLIPVRIGVVLDLAGGALLAVLVDTVGRWSGEVWGARSGRRGEVWAGPGGAAREGPRGPARGGRWRALGGGLVGVLPGALVAAVCLVPLLPHLPVRTTRWSVPAAFRSPASLGVPAGTLVALSPYPSSSDPEVEVWLAVAGDRWRSSGGTYFVPGRGGRVTVGGPALEADVIDALIGGGARTLTSLTTLRPAVLASIRADGIGAVIVGPSPRWWVVAAWWTSVLGRGRVVGGVEVWRT
jgi:hypothetical protein